MSETDGFDPEPLMQIAETFHGFVDLAAGYRAKAISEGFDDTIASHMADVFHAELMKSVWAVYTAGEVAKSQSTVHLLELQAQQGRRRR